MELKNPERLELLELLRGFQKEKDRDIPESMTQLDDGRIIPLPPRGRLSFPKVFNYQVTCWGKGSQQVYFNGTYLGDVQWSSCP